MVGTPRGNWYTPSWDCGNGNANQLVVYHFERTLRASAVSSQPLILLLELPQSERCELVRRGNSFTYVQVKAPHHADRHGENVPPPEACLQAIGVHLQPVGGGDPRADA